MMNMVSTLVYNEYFEDGSAILFTYTTPYGGVIAGRYVSGKLIVESPTNKLTGKPSAAREHIKEAKKDMQERIKNYRQSHPEWFKKHRNLYKGE
jgi:hypothetical protein